MQTDRVSLQTAPAHVKLRAAITPYQRADFRRSLWQVANTFIPYILLWYLMYRSLAVSYWLTLALIVLASGFLIRVFIILHDCGHGSFFPSQRANDLLGSICGVLTFTPYQQWRHDHAVHHATAGDLDRRGHGDVHTLTVAEYRAMSPVDRLKYRIFRHPVLMMLGGPAWAFLLSQRLPQKHSRPRERRSVHLTNLAILAVAVGLSLLIGWKAYLLIQLSVALLAATVAVWLFYCQHQFEEAYWAQHEEWDFERAAIEGSSYFQMPKVMQWFTGNIGFHHVHHFNPRIPNYHLEASHKAHPRFQEATVLTWTSSLQCFTFKLWDEERQRMVRLRELGPLG